MYVHVIGSATSGGGAGGRIAVLVSSSEYTGTYVTYGGASAYSYGAAGTVYVEEADKKTLIVDNKEPYSVKVRYSPNLGFGILFLHCI